MKCDFQVFTRRVRMKLEKKYEENNREYYCDITRKLDELCGYTDKYSRFKNYIYDTRDRRCNCLAIRLPGRTTGNIELNKNNEIVKLSFREDVVGEDKPYWYPSNVIQEMEQYLGVSLEM